MQAVLGKPIALEFCKLFKFVNISTSITTGTCTTTTITNWAEDISAHIKSIDCDHLVTIGDEGFYNEPSAATEPYQCVLSNHFFRSFADFMM